MRHHYLKNLWRWKCGLEEHPEPTITPLAEMQSTEWSDRFARLMSNRLVFGGYRYGKVSDTRKYNWIESAIKRGQEYLETGNDELLVDMANLAMVEFVKGTHHKKHFSSVDDGEHAEER